MLAWLLSTIKHKKMLLLRHPFMMESHTLEVTCFTPFQMLMQFSWRYVYVQSNDGTPTLSQFCATICHVVSCGTKLVFPALLVCIRDSTFFLISHFLFIVIFLCTLRKIKSYMIIVCVYIFFYNLIVEWWETWALDVFIQITKKKKMLIKL